MLLSVFGVLLIGMVNLMVSFSLALFVALRSKEVRFVDWSRLTKQLLSHLMTHPSDFFWPRDKPMKYARIDSQGQIIFDDTTTNSNEPLPKNYVVRRLSDVKILPKSLQKNKADKQSVTDIHYTSPSAEHSTNSEQHNNDAHTPVNKAAMQKTIELDDGLTEEALSSSIHNQDIQYPAFNDNNHLSADTTNQNSSPDNPEIKAAGDAKIPLPKPKKPPNLPS